MDVINKLLKTLKLIKEAVKKQVNPCKNNLIFLDKKWGKGFGGTEKFFSATVFRKCKLSYHFL